jgi:hypothetical protein
MHASTGIVSTDFRPHCGQVSVLVSTTSADIRRLA